MTDIQIRQLKDTDIISLHAAFNLAFSTYDVPLQLSRPDFERRLWKKLHCSTEQSWVATLNNHLLGFVLHTRVTNHDGHALYNGGTGVIPEFRGQGIARKLYKTSIDFAIKDQSTKSIFLEYISGNTIAKQLYSSLGFEATRSLKCFKGDHISIKRANRNCQLKIVKTFNPEKYLGFCDYVPTIGDSNEQIIYNLENELILEAHVDGLAGYVIFQPDIGRISQLAVSGSHRRSGIGSALIKRVCNMSKNRFITFMNIPSTEQGMLQFLTSLGFRNEVDQVEMKLSLI